MNQPISHTKWRGIAAVVALISGFVLALGSATDPTWRKTTDNTPRAILVGTLVNPDLTIAAQDGSFTLKGGERFKAPTARHLWGSGLGGTGDKLLDQYPDARRLGATPVTIQQAGAKEPLYGLIVFNNAIASAYGPGAQSYYVKIPEDKIAHARAGGISVAWESMNYKETWSRDGIPHAPSTEEHKYYGWILWLSSTPL